MNELLQWGVILIMGVISIRTVKSLTLLAEALVTHMRNSR